MADILVPEVTNAAQSLQHFRIEQWLSRVSPGTLFSESTSTLLNPAVRSLGQVSQQQMTSLLATPISATQSLRLVWPHIVAIVSGVAGLLVLSYAKFMREEIRS